jgi:ribosomal protein S9
VKPPLENYFRRSKLILSNIKHSGKSRAKRLGIKHTLDHVKIDYYQIAKKLRNTRKLICSFCYTPIKIWEIGSYSCISCDRHKNPKAPYSVDNIQFTHNRCNSQDGSWHHNKEKTIEDFRESLTKCGVYWCEHDSDEAKIIFEKNEEYFSSNIKQQKKLEINMNNKTKNSLSVRIELDGIGSMVFDADEIAIARTLHELKKLSDYTSTAKSNTVNRNSVKGKTPSMTLSGRARTYIGGLTADTDVTWNLLSTKFSGERIPSDMLSRFKTEGLLKVTDKRGVYKSIPKVEKTEKSMS